MYGFTTINGRFIKTGRLQSSDGETYFDLDTNEIGGKINFKDGLISGTVLVGDGFVENAGITGSGGDNSIFLWGGETFANRDNADVWFKRNGHFRLRTATGLEMDSQSGRVIIRHANGQLGISFGLNAGYPEMSFYKDDGTKVYALGQNGLYYVTEIPESFTYFSLLDLASNIVTTDLTVFHNAIRDGMIREIVVPYGFYLFGSTDSYQYIAGQNANTETNKIYEGLKSTQVKTNNLANGWYV